MNTDKILQIESTSSANTEQIGEAIGRRLKGGEVIELASDLGGGKTTFVRGLARGINSFDAVASPTFTISKVYESPHLTLHHFDFYRLENAGLAAYELHDLLDDPAIAVVLEWAEVVQDVLPVKRLSITIDRTGDESRMLKLAHPQELTYLTEGLC